MNNKSKYWFKCGTKSGGSQYLSYNPFTLRLLVNIITDGSFSDSSVRWHLRKERKIKHLIELLESLNIPYSNNRQSCGATKIRILKREAEPYLRLLRYIKEVPVWFTELTQEGVDTILSEYSITDGCKNSSALRSYQISSAKEREIDILQEMFVTHGYRATKNKRGSCFTLTVNTRQETVIESKNISIEPYSGKVWCVNVDNGTLIVRRNGKAVTTLNTHRDGKYTVRNRSGHFAWWENFCLCDLNPEYIEGIANWTNGFSCINIINDRPYVEQIPIIGTPKSYIYGGKVYS